jgi:hypothetical protein
LTVTGDNLAGWAELVIARKSLAGVGADGENKRRSGFSFAICSIADEKAHTKKTRGSGT